MREFFAAYGLFVAEFLTIAAIVVVSVVAIIATARRGGVQPESLVVKHLNKQFEERADVLRRSVDGKARFKKLLKTRTKDQKAERKRTAEEPRERVFVLDFHGDIRATATESLRREVSAVLAVARPSDQVLVRLENSGGTVHEHGLAASQLMRIRRREIPLLVAVDKVAASGGYLMACVADRIMAAPFAIIGSIGVLAQLPNFHRFLEERGVDFEQISAGRYKRTLTMFGRNTEEGREKLKEELVEIHELFKRQIAEHRPQVDVDTVATGEHWYGPKALELKLVDEIGSSDDFLLEAAKSRDLYHVAFKRRRRFPERLAASVEGLLSR